jgi:hypothetical protein
MTFHASLVGAEVPHKYYFELIILCSGLVARGDWRCPARCQEERSDSSRTQNEIQLTGPRLQSRARSPKGSLASVSTRSTRYQSGALCWRSPIMGSAIQFSGQFKPSARTGQGCRGARRFVQKRPMTASTHVAQCGRASIAFDKCMVPEPPLAELSSGTSKIRTIDICD